MIDKLTNALPYLRRAAAGDQTADAPDDVELAMRRYLFYFVVPLWFVPGLADWYWHRRTHIERTSGTHESLSHLLMMSVVGVPITAAMLCEVNALVIALAIGSFVVHEGLTYWDVSYAKDRREVPAIEQHTHSFLEMLPFVHASAMVCLSPRQFAAMLGRGDEPARWRFAPKSPALGLGYVASVLGAVGAFVALPYAEEFARCWRVDGTLAPHAPVDPHDRPTEPGTPP